MASSALVRSLPQSSALATPCDAEPSQGDFRSRIGGGLGEPTAEVKFTPSAVPIPQSNLRSESAVSAEVKATAGILRERFGEGVKLYAHDDLDRIPRFGVKP